MQHLTYAKARQISIIEFTHVDGTEHGGAIMAQRTTFSVVSFPRYGDTERRRFRYEDVASYRVVERRQPVHLPTFERLMGGLG